MAHLGIQDFENFKMISSPAPEAFASAVALLQGMEALDNNRQITEIGNQMIEFPLSPIQARIVIETIRYCPEILKHIIIIISFLTSPNPFLLPINEELKARTMHNTFSDKNSDFFSWVNLFTKYHDTAYVDRPMFCETHYLDLRIMNEISNVYDQISDMVISQGVFIGTSSDKTKITQTLLKGFMYNVCVQYKGSTYLNRMGEKIYIHPGSTLFNAEHFPPVIIAGEIVQTSKVFARTLSLCKLEWIEHVVPYLHKELTTVLSLLQSKNRVSQQKLKAKIESSAPLFSVSKHSILAQKIKNNTNVIKKISLQAITIGESQYPLIYTSGKKHKVLKLSWKDATTLLDRISEQEMQHYGKIRCDVSYNIHAILYNIKLHNLPILHALYKDGWKFATQIPEFINIMQAKKKAQVQAILDILDHTMNILIPPASHKNTTHKKKQHLRIYKFLSLEISSNHALYVVPNASIIESLQTTLHTLHTILEQSKKLQLPKKIIMHSESIYEKIRYAYASCN